MPQLYALLNDELKFYQDWKYNATDNDIEIEPRARKSTSVSESGKGGRNSRECD